MTENNKNKKYTKREKTGFVKKITDSNDITTLVQKTTLIVNLIKMRARVPTPRESKLSELNQHRKDIPRPYKLRRFYTPAEVAKHS